MVVLKLWDYLFSNGTMMHTSGTSLAKSLAEYRYGKNRLSKWIEKQMFTCEDSLKSL